MDKNTVGWIASFLQGRTTSIQLRELATEDLEINTGIPQGSPMSPVSYLFYNADVLEDAAQGVPNAATGG